MLRPPAVKSLLETSFFPPLIKLSLFVDRLSELFDVDEAEAFELDDFFAFPKNPHGVRDVVGAFVDAPEELPLLIEDRRAPPTLSGSSRSLRCRRCALVSIVGSVQATSNIVTSSVENNNG